ncbi:hypothetical protein Tsubulata_034059 [Turnera subulata]|uniref:F-box/LRR-repeat protein 15/At3g58940/PEG3-like LRR domain-containing protein n=1 Tax=Turnera subulata TaxID=218843 RepID=A0A9Q0FF78_9ROSI|nr:hypothetical protein Tsubulata_034059 [Turnera subulata]
MEITMKRLILLVWAKLGSLWCGNGDLDQVDLDLNLCRYHDCRIPDPWDSDDYLKFTDFVHQVLFHYQRSNIQRLHLTLRGLFHAIQACRRMPPDSRRHGEEVLKREKDLADTCIHFAMTKEVKILVLDFVACYWMDPNIYQRGMYKVSDYLFSCDSLQQLSLVYCQIVAPAGQICMKSLQTLYLRHVRLDERTIENLVSGCPSLENLSLISCFGLQNLNFGSPSLKHLKIFHEIDRKISGPNFSILGLPSVSNILRRSPFLERLEIQVHPELGGSDWHSVEIHPGGIRDELEVPTSIVGATYICFVLHILFCVPKHMVGKKIIPKVRGREDDGSFKFVSNHLRIVIIYCWGMNGEDPAMDYELVRLVGFLLMAARKLEKIVISPTPTFNYKKIFRSLPAASPRAVIFV